jgi:hypothetical protein
MGVAVQLNIDEQRRRLAEAVREACIQAAAEGYESAALSGLCEEGALEAAVSAIRMLDLDVVIERTLDTTSGER